MAMELPFVLVGGLLIGGGLGYLIDRWLHTGPVMMVLLGILGFLGGLWDVIKILTHSSGSKHNGSS